MNSPNKYSLETKKKLIVIKYVIKTIINLIYGYLNCTVFNLESLNIFPLCLLALI